MKLKINQTVRVHLTQTGLDRLREDYATHKQVLPPITDGWLSMPLDFVMHLFGPDLYPGTVSAPFDGIEIPEPEPAMWQCPKCQRWNSANQINCLSEYDTGIPCDGKQPYPAAPADAGDAAKVIEKADACCGAIIESSDAARSGACDVLEAHAAIVCCAREARAMLAAARRLLDAATPASDPNLAKLEWANANLVDTLKRLRQWASNSPTGPVEAHGVAAWVKQVIDHGLKIGDPRNLPDQPVREAATEPVRTKLDVELTVAALRLLEIFLAENRQLILDYLSAPEVNA